MLLLRKPGGFEGLRAVATTSPPITPTSGYDATLARIDLDREGHLSRTP